MKRLVVYLDGTWNRPRAKTNVHRLYEITAPVDDAGVRQAANYWTGVGTRPLEWLRGGALGFGTDRNIRDAYGWLAAEYEDGDDVFVLGFSRGAYAARSLAGMIARCGLLLPGATTSVAEIYRRYAARDQVLVPDSRRIPIHFVGVWDTVGALGVPWGHVPGLSRSMLQFHDTSPSPSYRNMFHAVAIDENRAAFEPTLWTAGPGFTLGPDQRLEQRWFAGSHCNVGGGTSDAGLARITLAWMQARARECGLAFSRQAVAVPADDTDRIGDSFATFLAGTYRWARRNHRYYRPIGATASPMPLNETIDGSVFRRWTADAGYRGTSQNLAAWVRTHRMEPAAVDGAVPARAAAPAGAAR
jgi:uncharacterized protein (DUF2235 family)